MEQSCSGLWTSGARPKQTCAKWRADLELKTGPNSLDLSRYYGDDQSWLLHLSLEEALVVRVPADRLHAVLHT